MDYGWGGGLCILPRLPSDPFGSAGGSDGLPGIASLIGGEGGFGGGWSGDGGDGFYSSEPIGGGYVPDYGSVMGSGPGGLTDDQWSAIEDIEDAPVPDLGPGQSSSSDYRVYVDGSGDVYAIGNPVVDADGQPVQENGLDVTQVPGLSVGPDEDGFDAGLPPDLASSFGGSASGNDDAGWFSADGTPQSFLRPAPDTSPDVPVPEPLGADRIDLPPTPPSLPDRIGRFLGDAWNELVDRILPAIGPEGTFGARGIGWLSSTLVFLRAGRGQASAALARALEAAGYVRPPNSAAHHIVAFGAQREYAVRAREILEYFKIDINDAANGVFLPTALHNRLHTGACYEAIYYDLRAARNREEALQSLGSIRRHLLLHGKYP